MTHFQPDLMTYLFEVAHLVRVAFDKRARQFGMTRAQWVILLRLEWQPGISQKDLADLLEVEPITVARLVDRLEQRGFVERRPDPKDRRVWRLHLLPAAEPLLERIKHERDELLHLVTSGMDAAAIAEMTERLRSMKAVLCANVRCNRKEEAICATDHEAEPAGSEAATEWEASASAEVA
jgi:MarR family transcriptional regulator for hemolysin